MSLKRLEKAYKDYKSLKRDVEFSNRKLGIESVREGQVVTRSKSSCTKLLKKYKSDCNALDLPNMFTKIRVAKFMGGDSIVDKLYKKYKEVDGYIYISLMDEGVVKHTDIENLNAYLKNETEQSLRELLQKSITCARSREEYSETCVSDNERDVGHEVSLWSFVVMYNVISDLLEQLESKKRKKKGKGKSKPKKLTSMLETLAIEDDEEEKTDISFLMEKITGSIVEEYVLQHTIEQLIDDTNKLSDNTIIIIFRHLLEYASYYSRSVNDKMYSYILYLSRMDETRSDVMSGKFLLFDTALLYPLIVDSTDALLRRANYYLSYMSGTDNHRILALLEIMMQSKDALGNRMYFSKDVMETKMEIDENAIQRSMVFGKGLTFKEWLQYFPLQPNLYQKSLKEHASDSKRSILENRTISKRVKQENDADSLFEKMMLKMK